MFYEAHEDDRTFKVICISISLISKLEKEYK